MLDRYFNCTHQTIYKYILNDLRKSREWVLFVIAFHVHPMMLAVVAAGYCNCTIHHIKFCPVNLRLISCRALGNLDISPGGTTVVLGDGFIVREIRLPFTLRWHGLELNECGLGLKPEGGTLVSSILVC